MLVFVFYCNKFVRFVSTGANSHDAFTNLTSEQKTYWANHGESCVKVSSTYQANSLSYNELLILRDKERNHV